MVSNTNKELPHFVRKQVALESQRLADALQPAQIVAELHGHRILCLELLPHPAREGEVLRSPFALLDFYDQTWHLLFRTTQGHWQPVPDQVPDLNLSAKVQTIIDDPDHLFWRT